MGQLMRLESTDSLAHSLFQAVVKEILRKFRNEDSFKTSTHQYSSRKFFHYGNCIQIILFFFLNKFIGI